MATLSRAEIGALIARVESVQHAAAEARRGADEALRRAQEASAAAETAETTAAAIARDLGVLWQATPEGD